MRAQVSLACLPGRPVLEAMRFVTDNGLVEPVFGSLGTDHVQLVPQSRGCINDELIDVLLEAFPAVQFRLHANVRLTVGQRLADLSNYESHADYFIEAARVSQRLRAPVYSAHSGRRRNATFAQLVDNTLRCEDLFGCPVAIEGQYPSARGEELLVSSWAEYGQLLEANVFFAIDLSHLSILATASGDRSMALVQELVSSPRCIEVHISDNDGRWDQHKVCDRPTWWSSVLPSIHENCVVFSEGNHRSNIERFV